MRGVPSYQCGRDGKRHVPRTMWTPWSLAIIESASRTIIDAWLMRMYLFLPRCHLHSRAHARTRPIGDLEGRHPHLGAYYCKTWRYSVHWVGVMAKRCSQKWSCEEFCVCKREYHGRLQSILRGGTQHFLQLPLFLYVAYEG